MTGVGTTPDGCSIPWVQTRADRRRTAHSPPLKRDRVNHCLEVYDIMTLTGGFYGQIPEYVDHLHEEFVDPVVVRSGRRVAPTAPGVGAHMSAESFDRYAYPDGRAWRDVAIGMRGVKRRTGDSTLHTANYVAATLRPLGRNLCMGSGQGISDAGGWDAPRRSADRLAWWELVPESPSASDSRGLLVGYSRPLHPRRIP